MEPKSPSTFVSTNKQKHINSTDMKKVLFLALLAISALTVESQAQILNPPNGGGATDGCGFTYQQGYNTGRNLGTSETYYAENYQLYLRTLQDFSHCSLYRIGVIEGYMLHRRPDDAVDPVDTICFEGTRPGSCGPAVGEDPDQ
ncbi:MAG TPA: hypothetical protein DCP28_12905 [Cytophagales bacterium]|nr:hypothetical protein [Cytophagales bacterium]